MERENIIDICGDMLGQEVISRKSGYIETPNYPSYYPPDIYCTCNLTLTERNSKIVLTLIDLELEGYSSGVCLNDWLEYTLPGQNWGSGHRLCYNDLHNSTSIIAPSIQLHFKADTKKEARGFWLQYQGKWPLS